MVWFQTTAEHALGAIGEGAPTWIHGRVVGNTFGYWTERRCRLLGNTSEKARPWP